jgi:hypothetical protein
MCFSGNKKGRAGALPTRPIVRPIFLINFRAIS